MPEWLQSTYRKRGTMYLVRVREGVRVRVGVGVRVGVRVGVGVRRGAQCTADRR